jgi:hypothetical protein
MFDIHYPLTPLMLSRQQHVAECSRFNYKMASPQIYLSMATPPLLVGIWTATVLSKLLQEWGQISEEVFRGDRLPTLNVSALNVRDSESFTER